MRYDRAASVKMTSGVVCSSSAAHDVMSAQYPGVRGLDLGMRAGLTTGGAGVPKAGGKASGVVTRQL